jgi:membrane protease YdiL (CAAX protease family)
VHFEPLELLALSGFGMVLSALAIRTGRLGPGFVAHAVFNIVTFVPLALGH